MMRWRTFFDSGSEPGVYKFGRRIAAVSIKPEDSTYLCLLQSAGLWHGMGRIP